MPRINKDQIVASGIIYKLHHRSKDLGNDFYIGSTASEKDRRWKHKNACTDPKATGYNYKVYQFIREHDGFDDWELEPIQKYFNVTIRQLERYEQEYRDKLKPNLNSHKSGSNYSHLFQIDPKEYTKIYKLDNRDEILEYNKQYRQENRDELNEKKREKLTCICGSIVSKSNKSQHLKTKKHLQFLESQSAI